MKTRNFLILSTIIPIFFSILYPFYLSKTTRTQTRTKPVTYWAIQPDYIDISAENLTRKPPSTNYQKKDWYMTDNLDPYEIYDPYLKKCVMCKFTVRNLNSDSTTRDAIFSFMFSNIVGLLPFTRSLRTTGSNCRVFIFTNDKSMSKITDDELMVLDHCSITLVNTGYFPSRMDWSRIVYLKYPVFYDFLFIRRHLIDRVVIVDLYDTVFQGDPFTTSFKSDTFYFAEENSTIENCWVNALYLQKAAPNSYEKIKKNKILNAGLFLGGTYPVLRFLDMYMSFYENKEKNSTAPDQGYFNFVAYAIVLRDPLMKVEILTGNDGVIVLSYFQEIHNKLIFGNFKPKMSKIYPRILHQYDTRNEFRISILYACPKGKLNTSTYIRDLQSFKGMPPQELPNVDDLFDV